MERHLFPQLSCSAAVQIDGRCLLQIGHIRGQGQDDDVKVGHEARLRIAQQDTDGPKGYE